MGKTKSLSNFVQWKSDVYVFKFFNKRLTKLYVGIPTKSVRFHMKRETLYNARITYTEQDINKKVVKNNWLFVIC